MSDQQGAPPPSSPDQPTTTRTRRTVSVPVALIAALATAAVASGTTYLVMNDRVNDLERERDAARAAATPEPEPTDEADDSTDTDPDDESGSSGLDELDTMFGDNAADMMQCMTPDLGGGGDDDVPDTDLDDQVAFIEDVIADDRGFASEDYEIEFLSMDKVQQRIVDETAKEIDREEAKVDARLLSSLGVLDPSVDLAQAQLDALDAGVAGFYNPDTSELVIGSKKMDALGTLITSHELVHAMADSSLGLPDTEKISDDAGADAAFAALNAVEGDASLYSQRFSAEHLPLNELLSLEIEPPADLEKLPHVIQRGLEFPYIEGLAFACNRYLDGGWDAVDETYDNPPTTTAQVLFPDRYGVEPAAEVRAPAGPDGWELVESDTFGAADLLFLFEAPGDDTSKALSDPVDRVSAWSGGEFHTWGRDDNTAVSLVLADRGDDAPPLCGSLEEYYEAAFPDATKSAADGSTTFEGTGQAAVIQCDGDEVALGIAPDLATAQEAIR